MPWHLSLWYWLIVQPWWFLALAFIPGVLAAGGALKVTNTFGTIEASTIGGAATITSSNGNIKEPRLPIILRSSGHASTHVRYVRGLSPIVPGHHS